MLELENFTKQFTPYNADAHGVRLPDFKISEDDKIKFGVKDDISNFDFLKVLCKEGAKKLDLEKGTEKYKEYQKRLKYELDTLEDLSFTGYILLVWDVINFCKKNKIAVGRGRGSAAGSLVLYLIGVTGIDPIKYGLFFERFVSKTRAKKKVVDGVIYLDGSLMPDVDLDICFYRRNEVIEFLNKKFSGKTCNILNLNTLTPKILIKDCGKTVYNISETEANQVSSYMSKVAGTFDDLESVRNESKEFNAWCEKYPRAYKIANKLKGLIRNKSCHASGILLAHSEITDFCPIEKHGEDFISGFDMHWVSLLTIKLDCLGLKTASVVDACCRSLGIDENDINIEDPFIYQQLQDLKYATGLFQISADTNLRVCQKVKPKSIEGLSAVLAIARPGALAFTDQYATYSNTGVVDVVHDFFAEDLTYTAGLPLYQEQLMKMATRIGFSLEESEVLRKCVTSDTKFFSKTRGWISIKELIETKSFSNDLFLILDENGKEYWKPIKDIWSNGIKGVRYVELKNGNFVKATQYHQFLTDNGWKSRMRMSNEDFIAVTSNIPYFPEKSSISKNMAIILAGMMTEGYFVKGATATFVNYDKYILEKFYNSCISEFGDGSVVVNPCGKVVRFRKKAQDMLLEYMPVGKSAYKDVPNCIFKQDRETIKTFLSFSFACEGTITNNELSITSKSRKITQSIQLLLYQFGIRTNHLKKVNKKYGVYYYLHISKSNSGEYLKIFLENFKEFLQVRKINKLQANINFKTGCFGGPNDEQIPKSILNKFMDQYPNIPREALGSISGAWYNGKMSSARINNNTFSKICEKSEDKKWIDFSNSNLLFSKIKSLDEGIPEVEVFDFSIDEETPFIVANGMVIHNCVGKKKVDEIPVWKQKIDNKVKENNLDPKTGEILWSVLEDSAKYSFNKCIFEEDRVIEQTKGEIILKDVEIGDMVKSYDVSNDKNHFVKVLDVIRGKRGLYEIEIENGRKLRISFDHKLLCEDKVMRPLKDLLFGNYRVIAGDGDSTKIQKIISVKPIGFKKTIDLEVDHKDHNFYAEGVATSNSHSLSYASLSAITIFLKFKYPQHFFLACLNMAKNDADSIQKISQIERELHFFGIKLLPPCIFKSEDDFSIEGEDIRFGLSSVKNIGEAGVEPVKKMSKFAHKASDKFDIFDAFTNSGISIGVFASLIQSGAISQFRENRSRRVLEAQTWKILTEKERVYAKELSRKEGNFDLIKSIKQLKEINDEKGKPLIKESRYETIKKKYLPFVEIYKLNSANEDFANWYYEKRLIGYTTSNNLKDIFKAKNKHIKNLAEAMEVDDDEYVTFVAYVVDKYKGVSKNEKKTRYAKLQVSDERFYATVLLFNDTINECESMNEGSLPQKDNIVIIRARKKNDSTFFADIVSVQDKKIYLKLGELGRERKERIKHVSSI